MHHTTPTPHPLPQGGDLSGGLRPPVYPRKYAYQNRSTHRRAFTITELMFVVLITCFVSGAFVMFLVDSAKALYTTTEQAEISNNMRQLIGEMESVGRSSKVCYVYTSFNPTNRASAANRLPVGSSGDFVLFVTTVPDASLGGSSLNQDDITQLVGYFRMPDATGNGPVYKFTKTFSPAVSTSTNTPEALISSLSYTGAYPKVAQYVKGESSGCMFYYYQTSTVMIKANIIQGSPKQVTNALNLTIAPRG